MGERALLEKGAPQRTRVLILIAFAFLLLLGGFFLTSRPDTEFIVVTFPSGHAIEAEVADTPEKLLVGLAFREGLPPRSGMLYIFETSGRHRVWTKGFKFPVDVIWVDASRHVVHFVKNALPCVEGPCPFYGPPPGDVRYVIQTRAGFIREEALKIGAELRFTLRL